MQIRVVFCCCIAAVALARPTDAGIIVLTPSHDNTLIQQSDPTMQRSNGQGDIFVGRTNQDGQEPATISIRRGLFAFDIAGNLPAGSNITAASLIMRDVMGLNGDPSVQLHRLLNDWGEVASFQNGGQGELAADGDATWLYRSFNSADPTSSLAWSTPGGDFSPTVSGTAVISDDPGPGQLFTRSSNDNPQMIVDLQSWLDNSATNFGWLLLGDERTCRHPFPRCDRSGAVGSAHPATVYCVQESRSSCSAIRLASDLSLDSSHVLMCA